MKVLFGGTHMMRAIFRAAVSVGLLAVMGTICTADDYGSAPGAMPPGVPPPTALPATRPAGAPAFTDMQLLAGAGGGPLQLTLTADQLVLPEAPRGAGEPLNVQPTALHLRFKNASGRSIVLDTYNLAISRLALIVVGPEKETVAVSRSVLVSRPREALPIDYPQIEPGNVYIPLWAAVAPLRFPGDFNSIVNVYLYKPGDYKVQVVYDRSTGGGGGYGAWQGIVVSNTLIFHVVGPAPPTPPETAPTPSETAPAPAPTPPPPPSPPPTRIPSR
jgi:hypothetical protein